MNLSLEYKGFYNLEYFISLTSTIQIYFVCKSIILRIILSKIKTPQIFHCL